FPQDSQVFVRSVEERFDVDVVNPSRPLVGRDFRQGRVEVGTGVDLVDKTEPNTTFDPPFEGRQHAIGPDRGFRPGPRAHSVSDLFSIWHWRRSWFHRSFPHTSTFLHPLAPPALPGFDATMGALTPGGTREPGFAPVGSLLSARRRPQARTASLASPTATKIPGSRTEPARYPFLTTTDLCPIPSPTTCCPPATGRLGESPTRPTPSGLRQSLASSPGQPAESSSPKL